MRFVLISGSGDSEGVTGLALERLRNFRPGFRYLEFEKLGVKPGEKLEDLKSFHSRLHERLERVLVPELREGKGNLVLRGFLTLNTPYGCFPAVSGEFFRVFRPDSLIILEPSPGDLVRDPAASEETLRQQELERSYGAMYASLSDCPLRFITVEKSNIARSVNELLKYLRLIFKE